MIKAKSDSNPEITKIETDDSLQSLLSYGSPDFPFSYFDDDLLQYEGHTVAWHWHPAFECSVVTEGPVHCKIFKHHYILSAGDLLFINSGAIHSFWGSPGGRIKSAIFSPEFIAPSHGSIYRAYVEPVLSSLMTHMVLYKKEAGKCGLSECMYSCCHHAEQEHDPMQMLKLQGDINLLWQKLCLRILPFALEKNQKSTGSLPKIVQNRGQLMLDFLHAHFSEKIFLDDIAQAAHISRREALRCFTACFDTTPIAYLNNYRIHQAKTFLAQTDKTVTEISFLSGFDNPGYFCKVFHKYVGITPLQFRAR